MSKPKRILVVDDEKRNRNLLQAMLKSLGYEAELACDGPEALAKLSPEIDLVLLDVMMAGMDGFEVARRIRTEPDCEDIPVIMVTVLAGKEDRLRAIEAGANDFISKPVDELELRIRMASLLRIKEAQDAVKRHRDALEETVEKRTAQLRQSEQRFRAIFEGAQDCIFIQDRRLRYTHVNPAMERLLDRPATEIIGLTDRVLFGEDDGRHSSEVGARVLLGESVEEERTRSVGGMPVTFHEIRMPMRDESGNISGVCGIARNITERKRMLSPPRATDYGRHRSAAMRLAIDRALLAGESDSIVLLTGESGSGKDYLARFIHDHSRRANGPYFTINCAALPPELAESELFGHEAGAFTGATRRKRGLLELAEGGTLLLNEIGDLPPALQAKLLTFLDSMAFTRVGGEKSLSVNARLIAATNRDLDQEISQRRFRADLFHRVNVFAIRVPPLRERVEDIPDLAHQLLSILAVEMQLERIPEIEPLTMDMLLRYNWPGNVRELRNVLERSLILSRGRTLRVEWSAPDTPQTSGWSWATTFPPELPLADLVHELKRSLIEEALKEAGGKRQDAANLLKITRAALKRQMKTLGFFGSH